MTPDNIVTVLVPHCEMGQGAQTALAMMAAEEMDADWTLVRIKEAPALDAYANAYIGAALTGNVVPGPLERGFDYGTYRLVALVRPAAHRRLDVGAHDRPLRHDASPAPRRGEMLVGAAAAQFGVRASELTRQPLASSRTPHRTGPPPSASSPSRPPRRSRCRPIRR